MFTLRIPKRWWLIIGGSGVFLATFLLLGVYFYIVPNLPNIENLKDVRLQVPLRVYTRDMQLVAEFGEQKRAPLTFK